jgi:hypothetical protein
MKSSGVQNEDSQLIVCLCQMLIFMLFMSFMVKIL